MLCGQQSSKELSVCVFVCVCVSVCVWPGGTWTRKVEKTAAHGFRFMFISNIYIDYIKFTKIPTRLWSCLYLMMYDQMSGGYL